MLAIVAGLGGVLVAMTTLNVLPSVFAVQGGDPNNSDQSQVNAAGRLLDKMEKALESSLDGNPNNDNGPNQALENTRNGRGVEVGLEWSLTNRRSELTN